MDRRKLKEYYGIIYRITYPNDFVYIGQTTYTLEFRKQQHLSRLDTEDFPVHRAIKKYGSQNIKWDIIDYADSVEELNEKEVYWIWYYKSCIKMGKECRGYNIDYGGAAHTHFTWLTCEQLINFGEDYRKGMTFEELWEKYKGSDIPRERLQALYNGRTYTIFTKIPRRDYTKEPIGRVLDHKKVDKIIEDFKMYGESKKVGEINQVSEQTVSLVVQGKSWSQYTGITNLDFYNKYRRWSSILTNAEISIIAEYYHLGYSLSELLELSHFKNKISDARYKAAVRAVYNGYNLSKITGIPMKTKDNKNP